MQNRNNDEELKLTIDEQLSEALKINGAEIKTIDLTQIEHLLKMGANKNFQDKWEKNEENIIQFLFKHGADINNKCELGNTFLHKATKDNNLNLMYSLIEYGADIHALNKKLQTPLHIAAANGNLEAFNILLENNACTSLKDIDGKTAFELAIENKHDKFINKLFDEKVISAQQIVIWATKCEDHILAYKYSQLECLNNHFYRSMKFLEKSSAMQANNSLAFLVNQHQSIIIEYTRKHLDKYILRKDIVYIPTSSIQIFMTELAKKLFSKNISYQQIIEDLNFNYILIKLKKELNIDFADIYYKLYREKKMLGLVKPGVNYLNYSCETKKITFEDSKKNQQTITTKFSIFKEKDLSDEQKKHDEYQEKYYPL